MDENNLILLKQILPLFVIIHGDEANTALTYHRSYSGFEFAEGSDKA